MNKELLKKVRKAIAKEGAHFNQVLWWEGDDGEERELLGGIMDAGRSCFCGTPCCIAGYVVHEVGVENIVKQGFSHYESIAYIARQLLELTPEEMENMFQAYPVWDNTHGTERIPTREEALEMLDHAIEHDDIRWPERA